MVKIYNDSIRNYDNHNIVNFIYYHHGIFYMHLFKIPSDGTTIRVYYDTIHGKIIFI